MGKYSYEFKKTVVMEYIKGKGSYESIAKEYNVADKKQVYRWVCAYKELGDEGLKRSREKKKYSFEFKLNVVESYLTTEISYQELALSLGINNPSIIAKWVNDYRTVGVDALKPKRKGQKAKVNKPNDIDKTKLNDSDKEYLKQLEEENLKLRIENAYLKELRRLRLEEEANLNKKQELSRASEKNSN